MLPLAMKPVSVTVFDQTLYVLALASRFELNVRADSFPTLLRGSSLSHQIKGQTHRVLGVVIPNINLRYQAGHLPVYLGKVKHETRTAVNHTARTFSNVLHNLDPRQHFEPQPLTCLRQVQINT